MRFNFLPNFCEIIIAVVLILACIFTPGCNSNDNSISGGDEKIETDNDSKEMDSFRVVKFLDSAMNPTHDITVKDTIAFDYFGKIDAGLNNSIREWMPDKIETDALISENIDKFIEVSMAQPEAENKLYGWFTVRLTKPTDEFDIPRWHRDGNFFGATHKIAATIYGPGTLLISEREALEIVTDPKYMNVHPFGPEGLIMRAEIASRMSKFDPVQLQPGEMVVFRVGNRNNSAVHSEPLMDTDRIFVSVLPGTEEQIRQLAADRKGKFNE